MNKPDEIKYWSLPSATVLEKLKSSATGLTETESANRLKEYGQNSIKTKKDKSIAFVSRSV